MNINLFLLKKIFEYLYTYSDRKLKTVFETLLERFSNLFEFFFTSSKTLVEYKIKNSKIRNNEEQLRKKINELEGKLRALKNPKINSDLRKQ